MDPVRQISTSKNKTAQTEARAVRGSLNPLVPSSTQPLMILHFGTAIGDLQQLANSSGEQKRNTHPNCQSFDDSHTPTSLSKTCNWDSSSIISARPTPVNAPQSNVPSSQGSSHGNQIEEVD
jgi:hypothetical protein